MPQTFASESPFVLAEAMADDFDFADKVPPSFDRVVHLQIQMQAFDVTIVFYLDLILIDSCTMFLLPRF